MSNPWEELLKFGKPDDFAPDPTCGLGVFIREEKMRKTAQQEAQRLHDDAHDRLTRISYLCRHAEGQLRRMILENVWDFGMMCFHLGKIPDAEFGSMDSVLEKLNDKHA